MDKIIEATDIGWLLPNLGLEANRLDCAAKAYFCVMNTKGSSPSELQDARDALVSAIADINVAAEAVRRKLGITCDEIAEAEDAKIERWRRVFDDAPRAADRG